jgi:antitoxin component YwqK of YwqJK toxin-antitoxin module
MIEVNKKYYVNDMITYEEYYYSNGSVASRVYYFNNKWHKEDGPAYVSYDRNGDIVYKEYWLNDKELTEEEWFNQLSIENKLRFSFGVNND